MKFVPLMLVCCLFLTSCASTMPGNDIATGNENITATIDTNRTFTNNQIQFYQFSIKNHTNKWIEFDGAVMEGDKSISVLVGNRIDSWIEACTLESNVSQHNMALFLGAVAVGGAAVAGASGHQQTATTGAVVALGAISVAAVQDYQNSKKRAEFQKAFPDKHIFQPFVLPPGKVIQRWILVENASKKDFTLKAKTKEGETLDMVVAQPKAISTY